MRWLALLVAAVALVGSDVRADDTVPVYVTVVGSGRTRLLLSAGSIVPCDSSSNVRLVDGWADAGRTFVVQSPWWCVCEQHTTGAFRETNWTPPQVVCQQASPYTGAYSPFIALSISTDD